MRYRKRGGIIKGYAVGPLYHRKKAPALTMEYFLWAWDHQLIYKAHGWIQRTLKQSKMKEKCAVNITTKAKPQRIARWGPHNQTGRA